MSSPRFASLDYIRGLAVLGILAVNAASFAAPMQAANNPIFWPFTLSLADLWVWWGIHTFFEAKFYTLFAMLFGVSLYLVGQKAETTTPFIKHPLTGRLGWLLLFGLIHGALIWWGDILVMYAVTGFVFWRWRSVSGPKLLLWGTVFWVIGSTIMAVMLFGLKPLYEAYPDFVTETQVNVMAHSVLMRGTFAQSLSGNFTEWTNGLIFTLTLYLPKILGLMMIGLGLFKTGFFEGRYPAWPVIAAGAVSLVLIGWQNLLDMRAGFPPGDHEATYSLANEFLAPFVSLAYATILMLLAKAGSGFIRLLEPVGRLAFTNYLTQSLIMTAIFYGGRGLGLFGTLGYVQLIAIVASIWVVQIIWSPIWLRHFRYGPFEWIWRSLSQRQRIPIRR
ncbi:MAG: DUF418 domain-containing protein [Asticcacaulis sp.]